MKLLKKWLFSAILFHWIFDRINIFEKEVKMGAGYSFRALIGAFIVLSFPMVQTATAGLPKCYGVSDTSSKMWFMVPNPGAASLPTSQEITLPFNHLAEGAAYRASNQKMYLFDCDGDNDGPCDLIEYTVDIANGSVTSNPLKTDLLNVAGGGRDISIEGATFEIDDVNGEEYLYVTAGEGDSYLYKFDTTTWSIQGGYPIAIRDSITNAQTEITGLAYDPIGDNYYGMNDESSSSYGDGDNADLFDINLSTGIITFKSELESGADAEGITYAADGLLYTEDDDTETRRIFTVSPSDGNLTEAASFSGTTGDAESLACNAGEKTDMGDLPDIYGYAAHTLPVFLITANDMYLGVIPGDDDFGTQSNSVDAQGDDKDDGGDDDDGVTYNGIDIDNQILEKSGQYVFDVKTNAQDGYLSAWIDWNNDGDFDDAGETIIQDVVGSSDITTITLNVPSGISTGAVYMRVRYSSDSGLSSSDDVFNGEWASDGEVEDYRIYIDDPQLNVNKISATTHTPVELGDTIDYNITVANPSNIIPLNHLVILDTLPTGTTYQDDATMTYWAFANETYSDAITGSSSYSENDGTQNWKTSWTEVGDDGSAGTGHIQKVSDVDLGNDVISIINADNEIKRSADLSSYVAARLTLDYRRKNDSNVDTQFYIDVSSSNGAPWTQLAAIQIDATDANYISLSYNISSSISADTTVRFRTGSTANADDIMYIDNIKITAYTKTLTTVAIAGPDTLVAADDNITLLAGDDLNISYSVTVDNPVPSGQQDINNTVSVTSDEITEPKTSTVLDPLLKATLTGHVYKDVNGNGIQDVGEENFSGVTVTVTDVDGAEHNVTTDADGIYSVSDLKLGSATVSISPPGYYQSEGTNDTPIDLISGDNTEENSGNNIIEDNGFAIPATLTGHLYDDTDGNGTQDGGESDFANITVTVTDSDDINHTVQTDANGDYSVSDLPLGATNVTIDTSTTLNAYSQTEGSNPTKVLLVEGSNTEEDNGFFQSGTLTGHVYEDADGSGGQNAGDSDLSGITVTVTDSNGVDHVVTTDANGDYIVTGLSLGNATVLIDTTPTSILNGATQTEGTNPSTVADLPSLDIVAGNNTEENNGFTLPENLFTKKSVTENAPALLQEGEWIDYNITFANNSSSDLSNVNLSDSLPAGTEFVSGAITYDVITYEKWLIADNMTDLTATNTDSYEVYNDGNETVSSWINDWTEVNDNGKDNDGDIYIKQDGNDNEDRLWIRDKDAGGGKKKSIERSVNLSSYEKATLSFNYETWNGKDTGQISVQIKKGTDAWGSANVYSKTYDITGNGFENDDINITDYISNNTQIRFINVANKKDNWLGINNLKITVTKKTVASHTDTLNSMEALDDNDYTVYAGTDLNASFRVTVADPLASSILEITNTATLTIDGTFDSNATVIDPVASNVITITSDTKEEGNNLEHNVTMDRNLSVEQTYAFSLENNDTEDEDYGTPTFSNGVTYDAGTGEITVPAGVSEFTITNLAEDDSEGGESDEFYTISAGGVSATGTILDNDVSLPVTISYAYSELNGNTLELDFSTATEIANVGFNIYAVKGKGKKNRQWIKLNEEIILSTVFDSMVPTDYHVSLELPEELKVRKIGIAGVDVNGVEDRHGSFKIGHESGVKETVVPIDWKKVRKQVKADRKSRKSRKAARKDTKRVKEDQVIYLDVSENAVYRVTHDDLVAVDIDLRKKKAKNIAISLRGKGIARYIDGLKKGRWTKNSWIEFAGSAPKGSDSLYLKSNLYQLSLDKKLAVESEAIEPITAKEIVFETNVKYGNTNPSDDPFYDAVFYALGATAPGSLTRQFDLPELPEGTSEITVYVMVLSDVKHNLSVSLNGTNVTNVTTMGRKAWPVKIILDKTMFNEGSNEITLTAMGQGEDLDVYGYDKLVVTYDDGQPVASKSPAITLSDKVKERSIEPRRGTNYVIIAHPLFMGEMLDHYISQRQGEEWKIQLINVEDIYAAYGHGMATPEAIKNYLKVAKLKGVTHVQLIGAASYDYHDYLGLGSMSFIPSIYVETGDFVTYTPSDTLYVADEAGMPQMAIGRWPVRTVEGLEVVINKSLEWKSSGQSAARTALFIADKEFRGIDFAAQMDEIAQKFETQEEWRDITRVYLDRYISEKGDDMREAVSAAREAITQSFDQGPSIVSYNGHSSPSIWSYDGLLKQNDIALIQNVGKAALVLPLACYSVYADSPSVNTMAHQFIASGEHGAVAVYGASLFSSYAENGLITSKVIDHLFTGETIGEAVLKAKGELGTEYMDMILNGNLLGDVTLRLR